MPMMLWLLIRLLLCNTVVTVVLSVVIDVNRPHHDVSRSNSNNGLLILGLGRVGREVAHLAKPHFAWVAGTVRSSSSTTNTNHAENLAILPPKEQEKESDNIATVFFDLQSLRPYLAQTSHVLVTIPPTECLDEQIMLEQFYQALFQSLSVSFCCCWIGVISTAGVYGDHQGAWVTEDTVPQPSDETARRFLHYEEFWKDMIQQQRQQHTEDDKRHHMKYVSLRIFRCAGIYGPHQSALHTIWRQQQQQQKEGSSGQKIQTTTTATTTTANPTTTTPNGQPPDLINRIHVTDLARAVVSSMLWQSSPDRTINSSRLNHDDKNDKIRIYNLADDLPESRTVVANYAAELLRSKGNPVVVHREPEQDDNGSTTIRNPTTTANNNSLGLASSSRRRGRRRLDCKRVSNRRMKQELLAQPILLDGMHSCGGGSLIYPTYRQGLNQILLEPTAPWKSQPIAKQE